MEHISEVTKIIEHALAGNKAMVKAYGELLAGKLRKDGEYRQAQIIERRLTEEPLRTEECGYPVAVVTQAAADTPMGRIREAIKRAVAMNRMLVQRPTDIMAADNVWAVVLEAMKAEGMILMDKPVTTAMLHRQIEETGKFELALAEVAQELNEAIGSFDYAKSGEDAGKALKALVDAVRRALTMVEQSNPNWPLHKQPPQSAEDRLWERHLLRGTAPSEGAIQSARKVSP